MDSLVFPLSRKEAEKSGKPYSSVINKNAVFPTRLRELRAHKSISQQKLANEISVTKSTISLYEQGDNVPDIKTFVKIADFYEVSYDYLLGASDVIKRENVDISKRTGLSDIAIKSFSVIKELASNQDEGESSKDGALIGTLCLAILNSILTLENMFKITDPIRGYMNTVRRYEQEINSIKEKDPHNDHLNDIGLKVLQDKTKFEEWRLSENLKQVAIETAEKLMKSPDVNWMIDQYDSLLKKE